MRKRSFIFEFILTFKTNSVLESSPQMMLGPDLNSYVCLFLGCWDNDYHWRASFIYPNVPDKNWDHEGPCMRSTQIWSRQSLRSPEHLQKWFLSTKPQVYHWMRWLNLPTPKRGSIEIMKTKVLAWLSMSKYYDFWLLVIIMKLVVSSVTVPLFLPSFSFMLLHFTCLTFIKCLI